MTARPRLFILVLDKGPFVRCAVRPRPRGDGDESAHSFTCFTRCAFNEALAQKSHVLELDCPNRLDEITVASQSSADARVTPYAGDQMQRRGNPPMWLGIDGQGKRALLAR